MIEPLENKLQDEDLLNAPKVLRTHCYIQQPFIYSIECIICGGTNITWSEFEGHIWCYDCEKDVLLIHRYAGIFDGPIPMELSRMMGIIFDRVSMEGEVMEDPYKGYPNDILIDKYNSTWIKDKKLIAYEKKINDKLDSITNK